MVNLEGEEAAAPPWPRVLRNYPIILSVVALQYVWAAALILDPAALNVTSIHSLLLQHYDAKPIASTFYRILLATILLFTSTLSIVGFFQRHKLYTILAIIPQQFIMCFVSVGLLYYIWLGQFADGVVRTPIFLLADQVAPIFLTIFHTWALILIIIHSGE